MSFKFRLNKYFISLTVMIILAGLMQATPPGLPLAEDFSDTTFGVDELINVNQPTKAETVLLAWQRSAFASTSSGSNLSGYTSINSIVLGDVDGDDDLDVVTSGVNKVYLNNGTDEPFKGVSGTTISEDVDDTWSIALGDVDGR